MCRLVPPCARVEPLPIRAVRWMLVLPSASLAAPAPALATIVTTASSQTASTASVAAHTVAATVSRVAARAVPLRAARVHRHRVGDTRLKQLGYLPAAD